MNRVRLSMDIDKETKDDLVALAKSSSMTETVRRIVRVARFIELAQRDGAQVILRDRSGKEQRLLML